MGADGLRDYYQAPFLPSSIPTFASSLSLDEPTNYYYTGISPNTGYSMTHNIYVLKMDGQKSSVLNRVFPPIAEKAYT